MKTDAKYDATHFGVRIRINHENIVHLKYPPDIDLKLNEAKRIDEAILEQLGSSDYWIIVDLKDSFGSMSREAQHFFANEAESSSQIQASAIIVNNLPIRILVRFYLNFFKPNYETRIFADLKSAKTWLASLILSDSEQAENQYTQ